MGEYRRFSDFLKQLKAKDPQANPSFDSLQGFLFAKAKKNGIPSHGVFELTPLCNFDCKMCYTHLRRDQMQGKELLTVDQWKGLMREAWEAGMISATLTGGECLTYPGFKDLYLYLRSLGVLVNILTNGSLLDESWVRFFEEHQPTYFSITLYGGDEDTYERVTGQRKFAAVSENIRRLMAAGIHVKLSVTPSKYMGEGVYDTVRAAASFGAPYMVNSILFDPHEETGRSGQDHDLDMESYARILRLVNELKGLETREVDPETLPPPGGSCHEISKYGLPCRAGRCNFTIEWDGTLIPCSSIREFSAKPLEQGFGPAWDSVRRQCGQWPQTPECMECPYHPVCVSCPVLRSQSAGPGKQPLAICERTRYLVQRGVYAIQECEE